MTSESIDWDEDLPPDPEEEYQTFVRTVERTEGFRLLFVRCSPAKGEYLVARVKKDIPQKTIEVLQLDEPIDNLYDIVERLPNRDQINILFIQGLENSFYDYEKNKFTDKNERDFYSWVGIPQILNHLNQQRERFRDNFNICFVFLLRSFAIKYFIHRAPDFFDWRSSVFEFPTEPEILEQESSRILLEDDDEKYLNLTPEERIKTLLNIQELLEEDHQTPSYKAGLLLIKGNLLVPIKEYEAAIACYNQALKVKPDYYEAWYYRGNALDDWERPEEAMISYNQALKVKPDYYEAWYNRGNVLRKLDRTAMQMRVRQEFEAYLSKNLGEDAAQWLQLYLQGQSQEEIAETLNKPVKEIYQLREKISYHAIRVFSIKEKPELVANWLETSLHEHSFGLTPVQWQDYINSLTPQQQQLLERLKARQTPEAIAKEFGLEVNQVISEWSKLYLAAQALRSAS